MKRKVATNIRSLETCWTLCNEIEIKEIIDELHAWIDKDCSHICLYADPDESSLLVIPVRYREETDEEYERRLLSYKRRDEEIERNERETYERLKAKYENKEN